MWVGMPGEETEWRVLDRIFEEAVHLHGGDLKKIVDYVKGRIDASGPDDRAIIDRMIQRVLAFRAPDCRSDPLN
jgi:hypothetical protein